MVVGFFVWLIVWFVCLFLLVGFLVVFEVVPLTCPVLGFSATLPLEFRLRQLLATLMDGDDLELHILLPHLPSADITDTDHHA